MPGVPGQSAGSRKKPAREHELSGNFNLARYDQSEAPEVVHEHPTAFGDFDEVAQLIWDHFEPMLYNNGTMSAADGLAFSLMCQTYAEYEEARKELANSGKTCPILDREGNVVGSKISPWVKHMAALRLDVIKLLAEFGLTPLRRGSIQRLRRDEDIGTIPKLT